MAGIPWSAATPVAASLEPGVTLPLLLALAVYLRGFGRLRARKHPRVTLRHGLAFSGGIAVLLVALASPLHELGERFLQIHMVQHLLLMMLAAPLLWLGRPLAPLLLGLPRPLTRAGARALATRSARGVGRSLSHPAVAWLAFAASTWGWHMSGPYELALRSESWHHLEHACFFASALLFWWNVIGPWPSQPAWPRWSMIPYLALADIQNTALCALLTFSDRVWYPTYASLPRPFGLSALEDQAAAGAIMWIPGSAAFLIAVACIVRELLVRRSAHPRRLEPVTESLPIGSHGLERSAWG
ncbi:MAG TPA: cytochrome c oxidase assembly protein [Myxococcota bacterium]|nr:cytochrome c oxidase assembly protein [Myxococcota bacterium]